MQFFTGVCVGGFIAGFVNGTIDTWARRRHVRRAKEAIAALTRLVVRLPETGPDQGAG